MDTKMKAVRAGHKGAVTKLLKKFEEIQQSSEADYEEISTLLEVVTQKKRTLENINEKILEQTSDEDVAVEIQESDEYMFNLEYKLRQITKLSKSVQNQSFPANEPISSNLNPHADNFIQSVPSTFISQPSTSANQQYTHSSNSRASSSANSEYHKLPKLNLPIFTGDILDWQSFWDSYETAIHTNPTLSDAQKFNYLKSLLQSEALQTIAGFSMTNTNYDKAISLLQERYGQTHKIVQTYMQALLDLQAPINTITSLRNYYDKTETYVRGLESLGQTDDTYGSLLVPVILNKLPAEIRQHLAREHRSTNWTLHDLRKALLEELNIMEAGKLPEKVESPLATATFLTNAKSRTKSSFNKNERSYSDKKINTKQCAFCHEIGHTPVNCTKVTTANARMNIVKSERLCFNCLGHHKLADCKSKSNCRNCNKRHHTSICSNDEKSEKSSKPPANETENTVLHSSLTQRTTNVLLKTAVATVSSRKQSAEANILLDEGAQRSFITETLAEKLDLVSSGNEVVHLSGFGEQNRQVRHMKSATVYIQTDEGENIPLNVLIIPEIAMPLQIHVRSVTNMRHLRGLKLAHPVSDDDMFEIEILIGADYYWSIVGDDIIRGEGPTAVESKLGYLLSGPTMTSTCTTSRSSILNVIVSHKTEELNLEKFWEIESLGVEDKTGNTENDEFQKMYEETAISFNNNRYIAKLPWKAEHPPLPTNKAVAFRRTESVIKRLQKEPKLLLKYGEIIDEQEKRGFIERVDNEEINQNIKLHYIPHHPVKKDSVTTPIRIVYDCSCKQTPDSASLNDCLLNVPPKLNEVTAILLRFRLNKYAVSTDIEKAFLNVGLDIEDRDVTRFFWLSKPTDPNSDLTTYRFKSVLFGATCSPFILNAVLSKHLNNHPVDFTDKLTKDLYVDNIVSSFESEEELLKYFKLVRSLFADGGFNLRSWASNSQLLQVLARTENVMDKDQLVKILGLRWDTASDTLGFVTPNLDTSELITKREVLRQSSRIYDPLGILSPITVRSKMLMQNIWEKNFNWDELLPDSTITEWVNIRKDIQEATKTVVPRHYFDESSDTNNDNVIHVFTDSSMKAYGACAYIVANGKSSLIMAKNRVAPLKQLTIPRLELMAAVIGSRLLAHIRNTLQITRAVLWSDSQIVLTWLSSKKPLKPFISNRVKEITELTEELTWRYCPSESNPADLLSRGITVDKFKDNRLWMHGPDWLTLEDNWPEWNRDEAQILSTIAHQEVAVDTVQATQNKFTIHMIQGIGNVIDLNRFNSFKKLLRITAYVRRFITNCRKRAIHTGMLNTIEIQNASLTWIIYIQKKHYSEIIQDLQTGEGKKHNLVKQLKLYIAQDKLIRCDGRIHNAPLEENTKFPILLPAKDKLTQLIIMDAHLTHFHSGLSSTVTLLRQTYWIPSIRQVIKSIIHKCVICKKVAGRPYSAPDPPPLPKDRLTEAPPFTVTGVDFTGALNVKTTDGLTSKVYICLFTCANTRAVHLEVVMNLSEETFILAFRRFASRKSLPKTMISDNGTTFIAAAKQLTRSSAVIEKLNNFGTTWKFIPKRAPWYGGFWERLIGLTKDSIKKVLGRSLIQIELLRTIVTEVEAILNDRPLTYVSSDPLDEPLTPSHLLYGRRITSLPYPTNQELEHSLNDMTHKSTNKLFKMKSQIIQSFWYKWKHEYLTALREYHRNTGNNKQLITIGDVVQIYEDSPRIKWTLAVVEKLNVGGDGLARSAVIRTKNGLTSRPITKLYPLEVSLNSDDDNTDCAIKTCRKAKMVAMEKIKKWTK
ncbi:uncharacterized protein [Mytilus edulis]|uniref:uncharacterized protein n=1 Tax=Mytilus edulis TaxID=6550 RepID=UPI0039F0D462